MSFCYFSVSYSPSTEKESSFDKAMPAFTPFRENKEKSIVQFFHCSAVNPENPLNILDPEGILPTSLGVMKLSTRC